MNETHTPDCVYRTGMVTRGVREYCPLCAAAPELAEALREAVPSVVEHVGHPAWLNKARAVLAKIGG